MDQFLLELKKLPRPQPILLGSVIAFLGMVLFAYREVIRDYWLPRWGDENGYYSYAYLVPPLALVMIWMRRERLLQLVRGAPLVVGAAPLSAGDGRSFAGVLGLLRLGLQHGVPAVPDWG